MKKLFTLALFVELLSSCTYKEYIAKDRHGNIVVIKDRENVIPDAIKLGVDSIYVVEYTRDNFSYTLRWMGEDQTTFWQDTLSDGRAIAGAHKYRVIQMSNVKKQ